MVEGDFVAAVLALVRSVSVATVSGGNDEHANRVLVSAQVQTRPRAALSISVPNTTEGATLNIEIFS